MTALDRLKPVQKWIMSAIACLTFLLVFINIILFLGNRGIQTEINNRQQFINQSIQLDRLNRELIASLANLGARTNDEQIKSLLAAHGITYSVNPPAASSGQATNGQADSGKTKGSR